MSIKNEIKRIIKRDKHILDCLWKDGDLKDYSIERADDILETSFLSSVICDNFEEIRISLIHSIFNELKGAK